MFPPFSTRFCLFYYGRYVLRYYIMLMITLIKDQLLTSCTCSVNLSKICPYVISSIYNFSIILRYLAPLLVFSLAITIPYGLQADEVSSVWLRAKGKHISLLSFQLLSVLLPPLSRNKINLFYYITQS